MTGLCECGCGRTTRIATKTDRAVGQVKGQSLRFINGHNRRGVVLRAPISEADYRVEDRGYPTLCWVWHHSIRTNGYGQVTKNGRNRSAHAVSYEQVKGPVPEGLELDHLCRVRSCVRPDHLEPVTRRENLRRSSLVGRWSRKAAT